MVSESRKKVIRTLAVSILVVFGLSGSLFADDTEIYRGSSDRPKVLIAFDDSGSMSTTVAGDGRTRMQIAQSVVTNLIDQNKDIDFGLLEFNSNTDGQNYHGGRIVQAIKSDMTDAQRADLIDLFDDISPGGSTPLCETTYEAYLYIYGEAQKYGNRQEPVGTLNPGGIRDKLGPDADAEDPNSPLTYQSPAIDCGSVFLVILTDGEPQNDTDANSDIKLLTNKPPGYVCTPYPAYLQSDTENCMPELAEYMANTDIDGISSNGKQIVTTYTIGFTTQQTLLSETAHKGDGDYFTAETAAQLAASFQQAINSIRSVNSSFTSPAVAVNTFTRTESRNEVFFAMFKPDSRVDWPGNIKRLNIDLSTDDAVLVDKNGAAAIETSTGQIKGTATTVWSTTQDGPAVLEGGVGALLAARDPATRILYSNTGTNDALQAYSATNMTAAAFDVIDDAALYAFFGVNDQDEFLAALGWGEGYDTGDVDNDGELAEVRPWILADMLHSKPLVVNYGARGSFTVENPDLRIVVGTNAGFLHMFGNSDGEEDWAFFAKELAPLLNIRRLNAVDSQHPYGIDSPAVVYTIDLNTDGTIDSSEGDKAYLYVGLRRGGRILYALDISNPDSPSLLWRKDATSAGFSELGETWSVPLITTIPGYPDNQGASKPVLVFGAGYDTNKDSQGLVTADAMGRGIFIVDAATGDLVWSVTPAANTVTNLQEVGLQHSVPAGVTVLDSNGDGWTDRIYFADTGGQLWRVDLPGALLPTSSQDTWRIVKVATVNGGTRATDRRFFNAPDVVRTAYSGGAFDAILIGSGDRTNPNDIDDPNDPNLMAVNNQFYMFRDKATNPYFTAAPTPSDCSATPPSVDFRCQLPWDPNDLYDVTSNDIQLGTSEEQQAAAQAALASANGWRLDLEVDGEKALARSIVIGGKVYLTTFSPDSGVVNVCEPIAGLGRLYIFNLYDAADRAVLILGEILPDTMPPHFGSDGELRLLPPLGCADCGGRGDGSGGGDLILTGEIVPQPRGTYWFREEY